MASAGYIELFDDTGAKVEGGCKIKDRVGMVEALSFDHGVTIPTDAQQGGVTGTRRHDPIVFLKKFDKASPYLYKACCRGQTFKKVVIHWYEINDSGSEQEYFRHELENVKITGVSPVMENVKNLETERYPHMEKVAMRYTKIKWLYNDGGLEYSDSWDDGKI
jgi:type VI secretion system secreted protein Hcp